MTNEIDMRQPFVLVCLWGSIGSHLKNAVTLRGELVIRTFDNKKDAQDRAKRLNKILSPGQKKYYGMRYKAVKNLKSNTK